MSRISAQTRRAHEAILSVDRNGLLWITEFRHPYINGAMELCSRAGDWDSWTGFLAGLLLVSGRPRQAGLAAIPRILGALTLCMALKRVARRDRPSAAVEGFSTLVSDPDPYSFPSSHAATSWAACIGMARSLGGIGWFLPVAAVLISYSRIHVGAHYPLDVLIGTAIGASVGMLG